MTRLEFSRATRREALKRSGLRCEATGPRYGFHEGQRCYVPLNKGVEFDHALEAELGGDNSLDNCMAICIPCHRWKTAKGIREIRKADRVRDKNDGTFKKPKRGFWKPKGANFDWRTGHYVKEKRT